MNNQQEITLGGITCTLTPKMAEKEGLPYVLIRAKSAGVFVGYLKSKEGQEVELLNARRIWYWSGAASISQLAAEGVSKPEECKFPLELPSMTILEVVEIIPVTDVAKKSIAQVKVWQQ